MKCSDFTHMSGKSCLSQSAVSSLIWPLLPTSFESPSRTYPFPVLLKCLLLLWQAVRYLMLTSS